MRIALFGGTGYVGRYLVHTLVGSGMHPVLLVRATSKPPVPSAENCTVVSGDIEDQAAVDHVLKDADAAIYNIGILRESPDRGVTYDTLHFEGARRAMDAAGRAGVKRFLLMSANGVRADGTAYQRTKYLAEQYLTTTTLDWTVFRPSVLFGDPGGRMEFATQLLRDIIYSPLPAPLFYEGLLPFDAGQFRLSPVHVADVAQAFVNALQRTETHGKVLPLGGPHTLSWQEILATIAAAVGKRKLMMPTPAWGVSAAAALLDRFDAFPITRDQIRMLMEGNTCSADAFGQLGIEPAAFDVQQLRYLATPEKGIDPWQQNAA